MKLRVRLSVIPAILGFLSLIFDSETALSGAISGIEVCLKTVIPSLFPFFILTLYITNSLSDSSFPLLRPLGVLFGVPEKAEGILLCAFLGGYPSGAQSISSAYKKQLLSREDAGRMLLFCNNAGPAFLFGIIGKSFSHSAQIWMLWGIQLLGALIIARIRPSRAATPIPNKIPSHSGSDIMLQTVKAMAQICGWIILFRVILTFLSRWILWIFPEPVQILVAGILELSNGCLLLSGIHDEALRFVMASAFLSFGGFCVTLQTRSVAGELFSGAYIGAKLLQAAICILLAAAVYFRWLFLIFAGACCLHQVYFYRKSSSNPKPYVV